MNKPLSAALILLTSLAISFLINYSAPLNDASDKYIPSEWFYFQRAYPYNSIPQEEYFEAVGQKDQMLRLSKDQFTGEWYPAGPYNIGGRITALDYDPVNNFLYAAAAAGGVFKSTDGGTSWMPKTDFFPSLSVGALKIDRQHPNIIYCGTGEANISTDSYAGFGMLKSTDFGESWFVSGLEDSRHIAEIEIHPLNSSLIYTAVSGGLYSKGENRGIYKSVDAGASWDKVLFINDSTSAVDVAVDPQDTNRIYAAVWERLRSPRYRKAAGVSSGIYLSTDAGNNWTRVSGGLPPADPVIGRISIAVAPSDPNYVYALYKSANIPNGNTNDFYAFYRSTNKGTNWTQMPDGPLPGFASDFGWYFGLIEVDPNNPNMVYVGAIDIYKTTNGGTSWTNITDAYGGSFDQQHPDMHALWIDPANPNHLINGNDGGMFKTTSVTTWTKMYDLPVSQFYASTIDYQNPERKYGGTQDNGTMRTPDGGIDTWEYILGGDGFHTQVDYINPNVIYAEYQNGGISKSTDGGSSFDYAGNGIDFARTNWSTPYILDPADHNTLYLGTYKLFRTTNAADNWTAVSGDLTRGQNGILGTITCISAAVSNNPPDRIIYVGTNDAKLSVTTNSGNNWTDVTGTLPDRYITDVLIDTTNPAVAYVTLSGYNRDQGNPHIFRTTNYGAEWNDISSNLPDVPLNSVIIDYNYDSVLYAGSDAGVFYTRDLGASWNVLGSGLPNSPVFDLNYHQPTKKLVAATHGRSMFEIDLTSITGAEGNTTAEFNFQLKQNYPNPFNPATSITYTIPARSLISLKVYDLTGKEITTLVNEEQTAGTHNFSFNSSNFKLASGVYFYKLQGKSLSTGKSFSETRKMILLK